MQDAVALEIVHATGRRRGQVVAFVGGLAVGLATLGLATVLLLAAPTAEEWPGIVLAVGFGLLFAVVGGAIAITAVEVLVRIRRARGVPVLRVDDVGIHAPRRPSVAWSSIGALRLRHDAPPARRGGPGTGIRTLVHVLLDEAVGRRLGIRDGRRTLHATLDDGTATAWDLTLWVAPDEHEAIATRLAAIAAAQAVPYDG